jgi:glutamine amidotransferase
MITIIDYGLGNLGSVKNMLKKVGEEALVTSDKEEVLAASKILLPGVGAFDKAIENLHRLDLFLPIVEKVLQKKTPILGICLGMQLLGKGSQEGLLEGFGFVDAFAQRFDFHGENRDLPVPHMGWNRLHHQKASALFDDMPPNERFYFVHSYAVKCHDEADILTTTRYGYDFVSSFEKENVIGCQFHPEKSHRFGMQLLKNFAEKY